MFLLILDLVHNSSAQPQMFVAMFGSTQERLFATSSWLVKTRTHLRGHFLSAGQVNWKLIVIVITGRSLCYTPPSKTWSHLFTRHSCREAGLQGKLDKKTKHLMTFVLHLKEEVKLYSFFSLCYSVYRRTTNWLKFYNRSTFKVEQLHFLETPPVNTGELLRRCARCKGRYLMHCRVMSHNETQCLHVIQSYSGLKAFGLLHLFGLNYKQEITPSLLW